MIKQQNRLSEIGRLIAMTKAQQVLAHVRQDSAGRWHEHSLDDHLRGVAQIASDFAADFDSGDWASIAGLWHDLGKYSMEFQRYIKSVSGYDAEAHIEGAPLQRQRLPRKYGLIIPLLAQYMR